MDQMAPVEASRNSMFTSYFAKKEIPTDSWEKLTFNYST